MFRRIAVVATTVLLGGLGLAACGGSGSSSGDPDTLNVVVTSPAWTAELSTFVVAEEQGYFEDEGIDVNMTLAKSGTETAQQVLAGNGDLGVATPEPVVISSSKGTALTYVAPYYGHFIYQIAALPGSGISTLADLKGKRIGITNANSTGATVAKLAVKQAGLSESDISLVPIGVGAQQITAINDNQVDALAMWDTQYATQRTQGIDATIIPIEGLDKLFGGGFFGKPETIDSKKEAIEKYLRAIAKATVFAFTNPEAALTIMHKARPELAPQPGEDPAKVMADQVEVLTTRMEPLAIQEGSTNFMTMDVASADAFVKFAMDAGLITNSVKGTEIMDTSFAEAAEDFDYTTIADEATKSS